MIRRALMVGAVALLSVTAIFGTANAASALGQQSTGTSTPVQSGPQAQPGSAVNETRRAPISASPAAPTSLRNAIVASVSAMVAAALILWTWLVVIPGLRRPRSPHPTWDLS